MFCYSGTAFGKKQPFHYAFPSSVPREPMFRPTKETELLTFRWNIQKCCTGAKNAPRDRLWAAIDTYVSANVLLFRHCVWQEATFPPRMRGFWSGQGFQQRRCVMMKQQAFKCFVIPALRLAGNSGCVFCPYCISFFCSPKAVVSPPHLIRIHNEGQRRAFISFFGSPKAVVSPPHLLQRAGAVACRHDQKKHAFDCFVIPTLRAGNRVEIAGFCSMRRTGPPARSPGAFSPHLCPDF